MSEQNVNVVGRRLCEREATSSDVSSLGIACVGLCARARGPPLDQLATHVVCFDRRGCGLVCFACRENSDPTIRSDRDIVDWR